MSISSVACSRTLRMIAVFGLSAFSLRSTTVSDTTFANGDWSLTVFPGGNGGSVTALQSTIGSNFIRSVSNTVNGNPSLILGGHIYTPFTYDPGISGPITNLNYSEDAICLSNCVGAGQRTGPAILQAGVMYGYNDLSSITGPSTSFHTISLSGLTAADFSLVAVTTSAYFNNSQHPDFSAAGAAMQFGFFRANGNTTGPGYTIVAGIDEWEITINRPSACAITQYCTQTKPTSVTTPPCSALLTATNCTLDTGEWSTTNIPRSSSLGAGSTIGIYIYTHGVGIGQSTFTLAMAFGTLCLSGPQRSSPSCSPVVVSGLLPGVCNVGPANLALSCGPLGISVGEDVNVQFWFRDGGAPGDADFSNAIFYTVE